MIVETDGYRIDFKDALQAFKFDQTSVSDPFYHGVTCLKAVDIIAEFEHAYVFLEIKNYEEHEEFDEQGTMSELEKGQRRDHFKWLKNYLKYKYRDTLLYRYAEDKTEKPIHYLCLINFDNALNHRLMKALHCELPVGKKTMRWTKALSEGCKVMNLDTWNRNFPAWPAEKIS